VCASVFELGDPDPDDGSVIRQTTPDDTDDTTDMDRWVSGGPVPELRTGDTVTVMCRNCGHDESWTIPPSPVDPVPFVTNTVAAITAAPCPICDSDTGWTVDRTPAAGYSLDDMEDMAAGVVEDTDTGRTSWTTDGRPWTDDDDIMSDIVDGIHNIIMDIRSIDRMVERIDDDGWTPDRIAAVVAAIVDDGGLIGTATDIVEYVTGRTDPVTVIGVTT